MECYYEWNTSKLHSNLRRKLHLPILRLLPQHQNSGNPRTTSHTRVPITHYHATIHDSNVISSHSLQKKTAYVTAYNIHFFYIYTKSQKSLATGKGYIPNVSHRNFPTFTWRKTPNSPCYSFNNKRLAMSPAKPPFFWFIQTNSVHFEKSYKHCSFQASKTVQILENRELPITN